VYITKALEVPSFSACDKTTLRNKQRNTFGFRAKEVRGAERNDGARWGLNPQPAKEQAAALRLLKGQIEREAPGAAIGRRGSVAPLTLPSGQ
jgi:hypothetical protein